MITYENKQALIIEDFAEFARSLKTMLENFGFGQVDTVNSGESAIRACFENSYDVIISDYNLGQGKNGMQVLEELMHTRRLRSEAAFIMATAENATAMVMGAIEYQPDAYITKPFNNDVLRSRLIKIMERKLALKDIYRAIDKEQYAKAIDFCDKLEEKYPKYKMIIVKLKAESYFRKRKYADAQSIYQSIIANRSLPWAMVGLAQTHIAQKEFKQACALLKETIKQFPMVLEAYDLLSDCLNKQDKKMEAQKTLEQAIQKSPRIVNRQNKLGQLATENDDLDVSISAYRQAIRLGQNSVHKSPDSFIHFTQSVSSKLEKEGTQGQTKLINEASEHLKDYFKNYRSDKVCKLRGVLAEGGFFKSQGREKEAENCGMQAVDLYHTIDTMIPAQAGVEIALGFRTFGNEDIAETLLESVVEQNFEDSDLLEKALPLLTRTEVFKQGKKAHKLNAQGIKFFEQGDFDNAIECFKEATTAAPQNIAVVLNTVQVLLKVYQSHRQDKSIIVQCMNYLGSINTISASDPRFYRFNELLRFVRAHQEE